MHRVDAARNRAAVSAGGHAVLVLLVQGPANARRLEAGVPALGLAADLVLVPWQPRTPSVHGRREAEPLHRHEPIVPPKRPVGPLQVLVDPVVVVRQVPRERLAQDGNHANPRTPDLGHEVAHPHRRVPRVLVLRRRIEESAARAFLAAEEASVQRRVRSRPLRPLPRDAIVVKEVHLLVARRRERARARFGSADAAARPEQLEERGGRGLLCSNEVHRWPAALIATGRLGRERARRRRRQERRRRRQERRRRFLLRRHLGASRPPRAARCQIGRQTCSSP
eukprot:scaffold49247_cov61-Phaeocystis_antarctica.AAC.2